MRLPFLFAMTVGSATALAQAASAPATSTSPTPAGTCSVGLFAQQRAEGATVWTTAFEDVVHPPKDRHGVHVVITHPALAIRTITLTVTFLPYGLRAIPTDSVARRDLQEEKRTFTLYPKGDAEAKSTGDLLLGLVSGVRSVSIDAIEYADGSLWKAPATNPCSVAPSGYVPVNAEAR